MGKEKEVVVGRKGRFHSGGDKKGLEATSSTTFADVQGWLVRTLNQRLSLTGCAGGAGAGDFGGSLAFSLGFEEQQCDNDNLRTSDSLSGRQTVHTLANATKRVKSWWPLRREIIITIMAGSNNNNNEGERKRVIWWPPKSVATVLIVIYSLLSVKSLVAAAVVVLWDDQLQFIK